MSYRAPEVKFGHAPAQPVATSYRTETVVAGDGQFRKSQLGHSNVKVSQHTHFQNTDNLYRPLKETFAHPQIVRQHSTYTPEAAQSSMVSKQYRRLNTKQLHNLEQNTYIPDAQLVPTDHIERVRGQKFVAVDATQRVAGEPISQEEMERIRQKGFKSSQVVYEVRDEPEVVEVREVREVKDEKIRGEVVYERPVEQRPVERVSYKSASYDSYGKYQSRYKYNAFSCIDQPVNECRVLGCGKCSGCPGNEGIARENHPPSIIRPV